MKKLKLVGYPSKVYKKTAFVRGMFNSALEVAKVGMRVLLLGSQSLHVFTCVCVLLVK